MAHIAASIPAQNITVIDARDGYCCVRCGQAITNNGSRHHRQRRQVGGHGVENVVLVCGSGTTGCHGWAHANPAAARAVGLIVRTTVADVSAVPLLIVDRSVSPDPFYVRLTANGDRIYFPVAEAKQALELVA